MTPPDFFPLFFWFNPSRVEMPYQVDKTMFSDLTAEMRDSLETALPQTPFSDEDDVIPVVAEPKVRVLIGRVSNL